MLKFGVLTRVINLQTYEFTKIYVLQQQKEFVLLDVLKQNVGAASPVVYFDKIIKWIWQAHQSSQFKLKKKQKKQEDKHT